MSRPRLGSDEKYSADLQLIKEEHELTSDAEVVRFAITAEAERIREERIASARSKRRIAALAKKPRKIKGEGVQVPDSEIARELLKLIKAQEEQSA